jgi:hypothetical protein
MVAEMALIKMCDTSLDTSMDSLLSRIAKLETAVATGYRAPSIPDNIIKESTVTEEQKKEPSLAPAASIAGSTTESPKSTAPTLKILRGWNEIVEKATATDGSLRGFLKLAKAFQDEQGRIYIKFPNDFARSMADQPGMRNNIRAAIALTTSQAPEDRDLIFDILDSTQLVSDLNDLEL